MTSLIDEHNDLPAVRAGTKYHRVENYPHEMRIFVNGACNHRCGFPKGSTWCHSKTEMAGNGKNMKRQDWISLLDGMERWGMDTLKIAGMEPTLHPNLINLISEAQSYRIRDLSMTTNGTNLERILPDLIENGLQRVTVSLHTLDPFVFSEITRGNYIPVANSLDACSDYGIPTKLNVVLLRGVNDKIGDILEYASIFDFEVKLYQLLWQPRYEKEYNRYFIGWEEVIQPFIDNWSGVDFVEYVDCQRYRYTLETENGVKVTASWFSRKSNSKYELCRNCPYSSQCEEGFMGYGFETESNLVLNPCYLRPELRTSLKPFLKRKFSGIKQYLNKVAGVGGR